MIKRLTPKKVTQPGLTTKQTIRRPRTPTAVEPVAEAPVIEPCVYRYDWATWFSSDSAADAELDIEREVCLSDEPTTARYLAVLEDFQQIDHILIYGEFCAAFKDGGGFIQWSYSFTPEPGSQGLEPSWTVAGANSEVVKTGHPNIIRSTSAGESSGIRRGLQEWTPRFMIPNPDTGVGGFVDSNLIDGVVLTRLVLAKVVGYYGSNGG